MKETTDNKTDMEIINMIYPLLRCLSLNMAGTGEIFFNDETGYPVYKAGDNTLNVYGVKMVFGELYCYTCEYPEYADNSDCWVRISDLEGLSVADVAECVANYTESTE